MSFRACEALKFKDGKFHYYMNINSTPFGFKKAGVLFSRLVGFGTKNILQSRLSILNSKGVKFHIIVMKVTPLNFNR